MFVLNLVSVNFHWLLPQNFKKSQNQNFFDIFCCWVQRLLFVGGRAWALKKKLVKKAVKKLWEYVLSSFFFRIVTIWHQICTLLLVLETWVLLTLKLKSFIEWFVFFNQKLRWIYVASKILCQLQKLCVNPERTGQSQALNAWHSLFDWICSAGQEFKY